MKTILVITIILVIYRYYISRKTGEELLNFEDRNISSILCALLLGMSFMILLTFIVKYLP